MANEATELRKVLADQLINVGDHCSVTEERAAEDHKALY